jgi:tetratricopeptide (TPR) repeat protein
LLDSSSTGELSGVRTRLELLIQSRGLRPADVARISGYSRQHLLRGREGLPVSRKFRAAVWGTLRELTSQPIAVADAFEPEGVRIADLLLMGRRGRKRTRTHQSPVMTPRSLAKAVAAMDEESLVQWLRRIRDTPRAYTEAAARDLTDTAELLLDVLPTRAEHLYRAAISLTEALSASPSLLATALRAYAEKGRANALRMLGHYREALELLVDAEQHFLDARYCAIDVGNTRYTRATILWKMEKWKGAAQAASQARLIFEAEHDPTGALRARIVEGAILADEGQLDSAKAIFVDLRKRLEARGDRETLARVWMNLAAVDLRRGDAFATRHWLSRAARAFRDLNMATEVTRTRWCGGKLAIIERKRTEGLRLLRAAMREFEGVEMRMEAGFVGLDLLEELVGDPAAVAEAQDLARKLADLFLAAGVVVSGTKALAYLQETVTNRTATPPLVGYVKTYVRRAEVYPDAAFKPPAPVRPA